MEAEATRQEICIMKSARPAEITTPRVIIVHQDSETVSTLRSLLEGSGYELETLAGVDKLRARVDGERVNLVIAGVDAAPMLPTLEREWPDTPCLLTGEPGELEPWLDQASDSGVYGFLTKPWVAAELKLRVWRALEHHALRCAYRALRSECSEAKAELKVTNAELRHHADNAIAGLTLAQELFEVTDAALVCIDPEGLIVAANCHARRILPLGPAALLGVPAHLALPKAMCEATVNLADPADGLHRGKARHAGTDLQWRSRVVWHGGHMRGYLVTIWEEVGDS